MDLYLFTLGLSFTVLLLMAVLGMSHHHARPPRSKTAAVHGHGHTHGLKVPQGTRAGTGATLLATAFAADVFQLAAGLRRDGACSLRPLISGASPWCCSRWRRIGGWGFESLA